MERSWQRGVLEKIHDNLAAMFARRRSDRSELWSRIDVAAEGNNPHPRSSGYPQFPDAAALIALAAPICGLDVVSLARRSHVEGLVGCINGVFASTASGPLYPTTAAKAAAVATAIAQKQPFPRANIEIAAAAAQVILAESGFDGAFLRHPEVAELLVAPEAFERLESYISLRITGDGASLLWAPYAPPWIFVGRPMSQCSAEAAAEANANARVVARQLVATSSLVGCAWKPEIYLPRGFETDLVYERDSETMLESSSAFVYVEQSPSSGGGMNFAWAALVGLPILHFRPLRTRSDLLDGVPGHITSDEFDSPADLCITTNAWFRDNHIWIADQRRRQWNLDLVDLPLWCALSVRWQAVEASTQERIAAEAGLDLVRVEEMLASPRRFRASFALQHVGLAAALGVDRGRWTSAPTHARPTTTLPVNDDVRLARAEAYRSSGLSPRERARFEAWFATHHVGIAARLSVDPLEWNAMIKRWRASR